MRMVSKVADVAEDFKERRKDKKAQKALSLGDSAQKTAEKKPKLPKQNPKKVAFLLQEANKINKVQRRPLPSLPLQAPTLADEKTIERRIERTKIENSMQFSRFSVASISNMQSDSNRSSPSSVPGSIQSYDSVLSIKEDPEELYQKAMADRERNSKYYQYSNVTAGDNVNLPVSYDYEYDCVISVQKKEGTFIAGDSHVKKGGVDNDSLSSCSDLEGIYVEISPTRESSISREKGSV